MTENLLVPGAPSIPDLTFRYFRGKQDFPAMISVREKADSADDIEQIHTVEDMRNNYANLKNSDPYLDTVLVQVNGEVIAYKRVSWWQELDGTYIYCHFSLWS